MRRLNLDEISGAGSTGTDDPHPSFQTVQTRVHPTFVGVGVRQQDAGAHELQVQPGSSRPPHLGEPGRQHLGGSGEFPRPHRSRLMGESLPLLRGDVDESVVHCIGYGSEDHQVTHPAQQVLGKAARILPHLDDLVNGGEDLVGVPGCEGVNDLVEEGFGGVTEQGCRLLLADVAIGGAAE